MTSLTLKRRSGGQSIATTASFVRRYRAGVRILTALSRNRFERAERKRSADQNSEDKQQKPTRTVNACRPCWVGFRFLDRSHGLVKTGPDIRRFSSLTLGFRNRILVLLRLHESNQGLRLIRRDALFFITGHVGRFLQLLSFQNDLD